MSIRLLAFACCLLAGQGLLVSQEFDPANSKEVQVILREQETALRRIKQLKGRVVRLRDRLSAEGRTDSVELLDAALRRLEEVDLEKKMSVVADNVRAGQAFA